MAEGKKIKYEDLFDPKLDDQVKQLEATFTSLKDSLKEFAAVAGKEIKMTGMKTPEDMQKLAKGINDVETAAKSLKIVEDEEIKAKLRWKEAEKERTATLKAQVQAEQAQVGSVAQLRAQLSLVTQQWKTLGREERENSERGKALIQQKQQLTAELKKLEAATGDHRRNVGNYTESLKDAIVSTGLFGGSLTKITNIYNTTSTVLNSVSNTVSSVTNNLSNVVNKFTKVENTTNKVNSSIKNTSNTVNNLTNNLHQSADATETAGKASEGFGSKLMKLALSPVALIITGITAALYGLFKAFTATDAGATKFEAIMASISAVFKVLASRAADFAVGMIDLLQGNWSAAAGDFSKAVNGMGDSLKDAAKSAYEYTYALDAINDAEISYVSQRAINANKIAKLEFEAADPSKKKADRIKALEDAIALSEEESQREINVATDKYNKLLKATVDTYKKITGVKQEEVDAFIKADDVSSQKMLENNSRLADFRNKINDDGQQQLEDAYKAMIEADTKFFEENKRNNSKLEKLKDDISKADDERIKKKTEADKKAADEEKKRQADLLAFYNKSIDEQIFALETQRMDKQNKNELMYTDQIEFENKMYAWRIQKAGLSYDELERLRVEHEAKLKEITDNGGDGGDAFKLLMKERQDYLDAQKTQLEQQREDIKKDSEDILKAVEDGLKERAKLQADADQKAIDNQKKQVDRQSQLAAQGRENSLAAEEAQLARAERKKMDDAKKAQKQQEALELAKVFLNLVAEYSKDNPNNATAKALAMTLIAKGISKSIAGAFATGVEGLDGEGTETSDSNIALLSKGESVITARGTKSNPGLATAMNTGTVDEYFKDVYMPQFASSNHLDIPKAEQVNTALFKVLNHKLESLESAIREKPVSMTKLNGLGEWTEEVQQANMRIVTHHRKGGNRF